MSDPRDAEIERLKACLRKANDGMEEYERKYYLEVNKTEDLTAERDQLHKTVSDLIVERGELANRLAAERAEKIAELLAERDRWRELATRFRESLRHPPTVKKGTDGILRQMTACDVSGICRDFDAMADCPLHHPHSGPHPIPGVPHLYAHSRIETTGPNGGVIMKDLFWERKAGE